MIFKRKEKVNEKISLLVISTLVIAVGIFQEVFKGTNALDEVPANPAFTDINFYKCVVDAYNAENNDNLDYDVNLSDEQLLMITDLNCSKSSSTLDEDKIKNTDGVSLITNLEELNIEYNLLESIDVGNNTSLLSLNVSSNQLTELDVSKNLELTSLYVDYNQLITLDVSNNTALTDLFVFGNSYKQILYAYKGSKLKVASQVKVPSILGWSEPTWNSNNESVATIDSDLNVTTYNIGTVDIVGTVSDKYTTTSVINVIEITSDKYVINEEKEYIIVNNDIEDTIVSNINVSNEDVSIDIVDNKLLVKYGDDVLREFSLISFSSNEYDLENEYIYVRTAELDLSKINVSGCDKIVDDNKLIFKLNDSFIKEYIILSIDLSELMVSNKNIILTEENSYNEFIDSITFSSGMSYKVSNGEEMVTDGNIEDGSVLRLYYKDELLDTYNITYYRLEFSENLNVLEDEKYIIGIENDTIVEEFMKEVTASKVEILDKDNNIKQSGDKLATGDKLVSYVGDEKKDEYVLSVIGDSSGDGRVRIDDLTHIRRHIAGWINPVTGLIEKKTGVYLYALDMDMDGRITIKDLALMRYKIAGVII